MSDRPFKVEVLGQTTSGVSGKEIVFPSGSCELETHLVEVEPGGAIGRHRHPGPCWMQIIEGTLVTETDDGTQRTFEAGDTLVEEAWEWIDNRNPGTSPTKFVAVVVGAANEPKVLLPE